MAKKYWFIFCEGSLLLEKKGKSLAVPLSVKPPLTAGKNAVHETGLCKGFKCCAFEVADNTNAPGDFVFIDLRSSYDFLGEALFFLAGKGAQMIMWDKSSRFCPACGVKTVAFAYNCKICPECKKEIYPTIANAVMVLVRKRDSLLMVQGVNFRGNRYGLVAGFLEPGETLEECCKREVMEETNLKIKNLKYFTSRPWPFPSGIMVGYFADYAGGKLKIDKKELRHAEFFTKNTIPAMPGKISLARKMVDAWLKEQK